MKNSIRVSFVAVFLTAMAALSPARADTDPEALKTAKAILEATNASATGTQMITVLMKSLTGILTASNPGKGQEISDILNQVVLPEFQKSMPDLVELTAHTYADNFSAAELKQILAFYQTDIGKKLIQRQPEIVREQISVGQTFAATLMARVHDKMLDALKAKGLQKPQGI